MNVFVAASQNLSDPRAAATAPSGHCAQVASCQSGTESKRLHSAARLRGCCTSQARRCAAQTPADALTARPGRPDPRAAPEHQAHLNTCSANRIAELLISAGGGWLGLKGGTRTPEVMTQSKSVQKIQAAGNGPLLTCTSPARGRSSCRKSAALCRERAHLDVSG